MQKTYRPHDAPLTTQVLAFSSLITTALLVNCLTLPVWAADSKALKLTQTCNVLKGAFTVLIAPDGGIKIQNNDVIIFARPPKWDVTMINTSVKKFFQTDFQTGKTICARSRATVAAEFAGPVG